MFNCSSWILSYIGVGRNRTHNGTTSTATADSIKAIAGNAQIIQRAKKDRKCRSLPWHTAGMGAETLPA